MIISPHNRERERERERAFSMPKIAISKRIPVLDVFQERFSFMVFSNLFAFLFLKKHKKLDLGSKLKRKG